MRRRLGWLDATKPPNPEAEGNADEQHLEATPTPATNGGPVTVNDPDERPAAWISSRPNLVAAYPGHVPMGLPLPKPPADKDDAEYSL